MRFLLLACLLLCTMPAHAQDALFASEVSVDVTGTTPTDARDQAFKRAGKDGMVMLLDKIAPEQRANILRQLDDQKIQSLVKSVEVKDERIVGNRYRGLLRVSYDALSLGDLIQKKTDDTGIEEATAHSTALLVIPVFEENGSPRLFDETNPWWKAWQKVALEKSGGNIIVPYGDTPDTGSMTAQAASTAKFSDYSKLINRYGVRELLIVHAVYTETGDKKIDVVKRQLSKVQDESIKLDYRADATEDQQAMLVRAARDITDQILRMREEELRRQSMLGIANGRMMILVPMSTLSSWTQIREKLSKVTPIDRVETLAVSPVQVDALLHFRGEPASLMKVITAQGLRVTPVENYWVITRD